MENNEVKTSILYHIGNYKLEYDVIHDYGKMCGLFNNGPESVKEYLVSIWNETREYLLKKDNLKILDVDRVISINDFNVTFNISSKKEPVFFITFPNYNNNLSENMCVAIAITEDKARFFTMEHQAVLDGTSDEFVFGEMEYKYLAKTFKHINYGNLERGTVTNFATRVLDILEH